MPVWNARFDRAIMLFYRDNQTLFLWHSCKIRRTRHSCTCADQWHLKNRAESSARPRGRPARVGKSVAATSERDAAADAPADDEADRQRERHDDARVPARAHEACFHSQQWENLCEDAATTWTLSWGVLIKLGLLQEAWS